MLEDSISCSPGNDKKSSGSRSRRFHKNTKRKSQRFSGTSKISAEEVPCLESLYEESTLPGTQYEHFNPFKNEIILAAGDMCVEVPSRSKLNNLTSQGFVQLELLPLCSDNKDNSFISPDQSGTFVKPQPSASTDQAICGPETQFGITESEFVRFCDDVEIDVELQPTIITETPKAKKSIVDAILEDFCGSPYSESPPKFIADDDTPIFRFKSKSIRTYSNFRRKKPRRCIVNELASAHLPDDDGNGSDSSGLSVQEDLSQNVVPQLDTVDLNNSVKVCENLLNLSSYFSQLETHEKSSAISRENEESPVNAIVKDIINIKRKPFTINRNKTEEEFYGFSDDDDESKEDTLKDLLEDEDDVLQQINCDSLCYENIAPKSSFEYNSSDIESALESVNAVVKEADKLISSRRDLNLEEENVSTKRMPNCDKHDDTLHRSSDKSAPNDEQLFDEFDLWHDTECLLNYKTQKPHSYQGKPVDSTRYHLLINNTSLRVVSDESAGILSASTSSVKTYKCDQNLLCTRTFSSTQKISTSTGSTWQGFSTASRKLISISEEAQRKADAVLAKFEQDEIDQRNASVEQDMISTTRESPSVEKNFFNIKSTFKEPVDKSSASSFIGFSTASMKAIAISDEAKRKAGAILSKFEEEEKMNRGVQEEEDVIISTTEAVPGAENLSNMRPNTIALIDKSVVTTFQGFSTASRKSIAISDQAKRKAVELLKEFEKEELVNKSPKSTYNSALEINNELHNVLQELPAVAVSSDCGGFSTASKKPIIVSDVGKRKAGEFLKNFEQTEKEERRQENNDLAIQKLDKVSEEAKQKAEELIMDIQFFDEAFDEELKTIETQPISSTNATDCKTHNKPFLAGFKTASKKSIQISEDAKRRADQLLRTVENEELPQDFLNCIQDNLNDVSASNPTSNSIGVEEQVDGASKDPRELVSTSSPAKRSSLADLNGRNTVLKSSVKSSKEPTNGKFDVFERNIELTRLHGKNGELDKKCDSFSQEYVTTESLKRKRNTFFTEGLPKTPALISPRRLSYNEATALNCIENGVLLKCASLPQMKSLSRKNLLSLSKRKKFNSPGRIDDVCTGPKTPEKMHQAPNSQGNANATPNLKEFFDSVSTSTPRLTRYGERKVDEQLVKDSSIDTDFRQINWEDANNSGRVYRTSSFADPNVTCSEVSPSPKQRIERLKMYGEPPPISPILMVNKCRPSGLRRGRSLLKP